MSDNHYDPKLIREMRMLKCVKCGSIKNVLPFKYSEMNYEFTTSRKYNKYRVETIFIPFSVGGGIRTVTDMRSVLLAGAEKVSVNSAAVKNPAIIARGAEAFGNQCIVLGMDAKFVGKSKNFHAIVLFSNFLVSCCALNP